MGHQSLEPSQIVKRTGMQFVKRTGMEADIFRVTNRLQ